MAYGQIHGDILQDVGSIHKNAEETEGSIDLIMKQVTSILFVALIFIFLSACGDTEGAVNNALSPVTGTTSEAGETASDSSKADAMSSATQAIASEETGGVHQKSNSEAQKEKERKPKILVAYFSCTGTTKSIAEYAAEILDADLYEIVPEIPYEENDLNYSNSSSRATKEQNDINARPAISGIVENMDEYDTILLAYPIWWGQAPRIINTFLEGYDFSDKNMVPVCTSHSSGIGSSAKNLHSLCSDATRWMEGVRFAFGTPKVEIEKWIDAENIRD